MQHVWCIGSVMDDFIQELHDDVFGALSADPGMLYVPVYQSRTPMPKDADGNPIVGKTMMIEEQIKKALSGLELKNGKSGIACVVLVPDAEGESVNSAAPAMKLVAKVRVIENRLVNEGPTGTGITASLLSMHVVQMLNRRSFRGRNALYPDLKRMIVEIPLPNDERCHEITLYQFVTPGCLPKVATPVVSEADGQITLSCTTPGAQIWYTLDGTFPGSGNAAAVLYAAPLTLASGSYTLRACAQNADSQASNDSVSDITIP